ncbi:MAG: ATP-binding cassette domain-containing protein [Planctomycetaceae bacterium]|nr:MAG: ATP-binding cassette domain-containing protein [Planctomycetaceae bacterium]
MIVVSEPTYAIETFSLTKIFTDWWGRNKVCAVNDLNLKIRSNEVFGLLGPNGSGKTTTLKMILSLLHPTKGRSLILGGQSSDPRISSRIGFLPEESYLYKYLSARETLDFYGRIFGLASKVRKLRTEMLLDMVGLSGMANRPVGTFSKGMARRIGLAQALINDPDVLILDEPTSGLDPIGTRQIKDLVIQLRQRGKTILLCSHLLADVEDVCDRVSILYGGKVQSEGKVNDLLRQSDKNQIITSRLSDGAVSKIRSIIEEENGEFEITSPMEKLESFFIDIVNKAQGESRTTSGAVSSTEISEFLKSSTKEEDILDKLVSASVAEYVIEEKELIKPQKVVEEIESVKEDVLKDLVKSTAVPDEVKPAPVHEDTKPVKEIETAKVCKDILEELTSRGMSSQKNNTQPDSEEGEENNG